MVVEAAAGGAARVPRGEALAGALRARAAGWRVELASEVVHWVTAGDPPAGDGQQPSIAVALFEATLLTYAEKAGRAAHYHSQAHRDACRRRREELLQRQAY